jgi:hypothetical protein
MKFQFLGLSLLVVFSAARADCVSDFEKQPPAKQAILDAIKCLQETSAERTPAAAAAGSLPVGAIIASMLPPDSFAKSVGDPLDFDPAKSKWVLANGTYDISRSTYRALSGKRLPPDLRGMFLRGVNAGRNDGKEDPSGDREAGGYQEDALAKHTHPLGYGAHGLANGKGGGDLESGLPSVNTLPTGDKETRPKNVAVYYYLKIN